MKRTSPILAAALGLILAANARGSHFDAFLEVPGIPGETDATHPGWIEVVSYSFSVPPPAPPTAPAPAGVARKGPGTLRLVRKVDKASPLLRQASASGKLLPAVQFGVRAPGGTSYLEFRLNNAMISSYTISGATESLSLNFTSIELKYGEQKAPPKVVAPNAANPH